MRIHFLGANRQVTGSRYCLEVGHQRVMIDCGMFQEREFVGRNWEHCPVPASTVDALLLTHIHIDHSGLLPKLVHEGFRGAIHATAPTEALAEVMLSDAADIQEEDAKYKRKRHQREHRKGKHEEKPLFTRSDVRRTLPLFKGCGYGEAIRVTDQVSCVFHDAGHILGSSILEVKVREGERQRTIVFSGDIGQWGKPLIHDPTLLSAADFVVMESTYGDRDHVEGGDIETQIYEILHRTLERGGRVVIPTFAVERAQELMYYISALVHAGRLPGVPIFLDSPMAADVTEIFRRFRSYLDDETWERIESSEPPLRFPGLQMTRTAQQSKSINEHPGPCIVMATSGMCNAGRIKHHLRRSIEDKKSTILFVGFQAQGTLGRRIVERESSVRIHGRNYDVRAEVAQIYGFSGHADRSDLMRWAKSFSAPAPRFFLTHGEERAAEALAQRLRDELRYRVDVPHYQDVVELD